MFKGKNVGSASVQIHPPVLFDRYIVISVIALLSLGLLMVASASMVISERQFGTPFHYLFRQCSFVFLGLLLSFAIMRISLRTWEKMSGPLLLLSIFLLCIVLIPGIGHQVNGSTRWISLGFMGMQVSEFAKFSVILYMSSYLVRHEASVKESISGFIRPMILIGVIAVLLLKEPDFGAVVVITLTTLSLLFLAGVRIRNFVFLFSVVALLLGVIAISSPYRLMRLTSFMDPWANQYTGGYQLTQSLIAFGRGGWLGVGLGASVQKLFYLPEAHTDFLFAVLAEELGFFGEMLVFSLYALLISRAVMISRQAHVIKLYFSSYVALGISLWLALQAMINVGVSSGILPTKGLTLPLMSYGGSSMLMNLLAIAVVLRIDFEMRKEKLGVK